MSNLKAFQQENFGSYESQKMQENNSDFNKQLKGCPLLKGNLLKDIAVNVAGKDIDHKLSRVPQGYIIVKRNSSAIVYNGILNKLTIHLKASADVVVDIWIF